MDRENIDVRGGAVDARAAVAQEFGVLHNTTEDEYNFLSWEYDSEDRRYNFVLHINSLDSKHQRRITGYVKNAGIGEWNVVKEREKSR